MRVVKCGCSALVVGMALLLTQTVANAQANADGIHWDFNEKSGASVHDSIGNVDDNVEGFSWRVPGVEGNGLQFDGYTTRIFRAADKMPQFKS